MAFSGLILLMLLLGYISTTIETHLLPEVGGSYIEGIPTRPENLNPLYLSNANRADQDLAALLFNGLTDTDASGTVEPELATGWDISDDKRHYTFFLRDDVLWHDGVPFSAEDIAFTIGVVQDLAFNGNLPALELWRTVEVEVLEPTTIRFTLSEEVTPFAPFLSFTSFGILPRHLLEGIPVAELANADFSHSPIGTGPWRIVPNQGAQIVLEPNPAYFGKPPILERLILRFYDDLPTTIQALNDGQVMGVAEVEAQDLPKLLEDPSLALYSSLRSGYTAIFCNLRNPLFQSQPVREALLLGLDRQGIINEVLNGQGIVAHSFLMPTHWAYEPSLPRYTYQPDEASELLEQEGWIDRDDDGYRDKKGKPFEFTVLTIGSDPELVTIVEEVTHQWGQLGLNAKARIVASATELRDYLKKREFDLFILTTPATGLPSDPDFYPLWHSTQMAEAGGQNYTSFASDEADLLLTEGRFTVDMATRRAIYSDFQTILARELPAFPLYHPIFNYVMKDLVKDVQIGPVNSAGERFLSLPDWYIKTQRVILKKGEPTPTWRP
jgi:peptide/nickel transport system substrate-binding protein